MITCSKNNFPAHSAVQPQMLKLRTQLNIKIMKTKPPILPITPGMFNNIITFLNQSLYRYTPLKSTRSRWNTSTNKSLIRFFGATYYNLTNLQRQWIPGSVVAQEVQLSTRVHQVSRFSIVLLSICWQIFIIILLLNIICVFLCTIIILNHFI